MIKAKEEEDEVKNADEEEEEEEKEETATTNTTTTITIPTTTTMEKGVKIHKQQQDVEEATRGQGMTSLTSRATMATGLATMHPSVDHQGRSKRKPIL